MKLLRGVIVVFIVIIVVLVFGAYLLPAQSEFTRRIVINRPLEQVYQTLNSFTEFNEWSPWADLDPNTRYQFEGPVSGVGATMHWFSDDPSVGNGTQEIVAVQELRRIEVALSFSGQNPALSWYGLMPVAQSTDAVATEVIWGFHTDLGNNPINRYFGLLVERLVGADYERGLQQLKIYLENRGTTP